MSVSCHIDSHAGIIYTTVRAPADAKEVAEAITAVVASPAFRPGLNGIADLRGVSAAYSAKDVRWIADLLRAFNAQIGTSRTAIVVSEEAVLASARMFQSMSSGTSVETEIFRDLEEARAWLAALPDKGRQPREETP